MKEFYDLHDPPDALTVINDLEETGDDGKIQALLFIVMHFMPGFPSRLDVILLSYNMNRVLSKHPMLDRFTEDDVRWAWDYLVKKQYLQMVRGH